MLIALFTLITPASAAAAAANILPIKTKWESKFRASPTVRWTSAWGTWRGNQSWGGGSGFIDNSSIWNPNRSGCGCGCCNHLHTCPKATLPHAAARQQAQRSRSRSRSHSRIPGRLAGATFCLIELAKKKKKSLQMEFLVALATVKVARLAMANRHLNIYLSLFLLHPLSHSLPALLSISVPLHSLPLLPSFSETVPNCLPAYTVQHVLCLHYATASNRIAFVSFCFPWISQFVVRLNYVISLFCCHQHDKQNKRKQLIDNKLKLAADIPCK